MKWEKRSKKWLKLGKSDNMYDGDRMRWGKGECGEMIKKWLGNVAEQLIWEISE